MRIPFVNALQRYWLAVFILASLVYVGIYLSHEAARIDRTLHISGSALTVTVLMQSLFWLLASKLWQRLVNSSEHKAIGIFESLGQLCIVNLGKYLPGKVWGMVARGSHLRERHEVSVGHVVRSTVLEQFFLLYAAGIVMFVGSLPYIAASWVWFAVALAALAMVLVVPLTRLTLRIVDQVSRRFFHVETVQPSLAHFSSLDHYLYLFGYLCIWLLLGGVLCGLVVSVLQLALSPNLYLVTVVAATAGYVAGFLAVFAPGGVGVREAVGSVVLSTVMPVSDALLVSLVFRLWTVGLEGLAGGLVIFLTRRVRTPDS